MSKRRSVFDRTKVAEIRMTEPVDRDQLTGTPAEIVTVTCRFCGDTLTTVGLSIEAEMCRCGTTMLDQGMVRIVVGMNDD